MKTKPSGSKHCSVLLDGAYEYSFGIPHFVATMKPTRKHLESSHDCNPRTPDAEWASSLLHDWKLWNGVEPYRKRHTSIHDCSTLSRTLTTDSLFAYEQLHERKSEPLFIYVCLVTFFRNLFQNIEILFLSVGHTHENIKQAFIGTSQRLCSNDVNDLSDVHVKVRYRHNGQAWLNYPKSVISWSGLRQIEKTLRHVSKFAQ